MLRSHCTQRAGVLIELLVTLLLSLPFLFLSFGPSLLSFLSLFSFVLFFFLSFVSFILIMISKTLQLQSSKKSSQNCWNRPQNFQKSANFFKNLRKKAVRNLNGKITFFREYHKSFLQTRTREGETTEKNIKNFSRYRPKTWFFRSSVHSSV